MSYDLNIREGEIIKKVASDYFWHYDNTRLIGDVDFCVAMHQSEKELFETESLLWAEAKKGIADIYKSFVQLILTIGKARTFDKYLPPVMLGAFDAEKIGFIPYNDIQDIFYLNDFNWNVTPSNHETKEFELIHGKVKRILDQNTLIFNYSNDDKELKRFIKANFVVGKWGFTKTRIDKNNFIVIYNKWLQAVKPTIAIDWDIAKKEGVIDGDFYLADLLSSDNKTLKEKLFVVLETNIYNLNRHINKYGAFSSDKAEFNDGQKAHTQFWNKYERPPLEQYWDYIVERRDLLVPQDVRERKGSFFTPQIWVELSQKYLTDVLGEDWQDEYYIWDCAAGTGNLLTGLTNKYNIWASTLDKQDVDVMHDRIEAMNENSISGQGANLLKDHVFQFDFLNDDFSKLPEPLQGIINDPVKRKKLVVYINPPYAEAGDVKQRTGSGRNKDKTTTNNATYLKYKNQIGKASNELFTQFLIRIYQEIPNCKIANFSKLKNLQSNNFKNFREIFLAKLEKLFLVPATTFDNVSGQFPIGFFIWNAENKTIFKKIKADVYDRTGKKLKSKTLINLDTYKSLSSFGQLNKSKSEYYIGHFAARGNDFQNQKAVFIDNYSENKKGGGVHIYINQKNLIDIAVSFTVRHCIPANWLNDRDQFLYPNKNWEKDKEFQNDCLAFTLFHGQNRISSNEGTNHWIPFTESEVNSREKFESNFMYKFIKGKIKPDDEVNLFTVNEPKAHYEVPLEFSNEAIAVFDAGRELWEYYHTNFAKVQTFGKVEYNVNASLYDIRAHFQGRHKNGRMKNKSNDETYMKLITELRDKLKFLAQKIEPKVYEYGFLKK